MEITLEQDKLILSNGGKCISIPFGKPLSDIKSQEHRHTNCEQMVTIFVDVIIGVIEIGPNYLVAADSKQVICDNLDVKQINKLVLLPLSYKRCKRRMKKFKRHQNKKFEKSLQSPLRELRFAKIDVESSDEEEEEEEEEESSDGEDDYNNDEIDKMENYIDAYFDQENQPPIILKGKHNSSLDGDILIKIPNSTPTVTTTTFSHKKKNKKFRKFERSIKHFFNTKCFYFSDYIDLTRINISNGGCIGPKFKIIENEVNEFFWNFNLVKQLLPFGDSFIKPMICGFVDSMPIKLKSKTSQNITTMGKLILISKKSNKRAGWRYMRRGIDDDGKVANFVQTDQILIIGENKMKFTIIRGSIPLFFSQDPINPIIEIERDFTENNSKFLKHLSNLKEMYNGKEICLLSLIERNLKTEGKIGKYYEKISISNCYSFTWFDFHKNCSKMRYDNVKLLFNDEFSSKLITYGYDDSTMGLIQKGIIRVNCIDCLDRTNIVQKSICEFILNTQFAQFDFEIDKIDEFKYQYGIIWFNNGDNLSSMYANTQALKGDFTKFGKRKYSGLINDGILSIIRYYYGIIVDYYQQVVIDFLLGDINESLFWMYDSILDNMDPNIVNKMEILKRDLIISNLKFSNGEIILGSWWVKSTFIVNNLRKQPLLDVILLLTNENTFLVKLGNEEIQKFIKVPNLNVKEVSIGDYFNDTSTYLSKDSNYNKGVMISFCNEFDSIDLNPAPNTKELKKKRKIKNFVGNMGMECTLCYFGIKFPFNMPHAHKGDILRNLKELYPNCKFKEGIIVPIQRARRDTGYLRIINYELRRFIWGGE